MRLFPIFVQATIFCALATGTGACVESTEKPAVAMPVPADFPEVAYDFSANPLSTPGFELGRALFYEGALSRDGSINCGSCHQQSAAFSHRGHIVSHGIDDRLGIRNAPSLSNLAWQNDFLWDGGVHDLDLQPIIPIENAVEMNEDVANVIKKLKTIPYYPAKFKEAFGTDEINTERLLKALSQFMVMLVSADSRYDRFVSGRDTLSAMELEGLQLFNRKCSGCHSSSLFTDHSFRDNGLDESGKSDYGRYTITLAETDRYRFKVPSLRNADVTGPYMHDGRFRTLESVLEHYTTGILNNPNLDPLLLTNGTPGLQLTANEKSRIILFIRTLTDKNFITDPRFAESAK